ncbi:MAG: NADPH-dependent F420 reductase [Betaproteobacteria bacterium]|nr:NADPH-dependent F420 reductase [Betaproteobacteria bacterium]
MKTNDGAKPSRREFLRAAGTAAAVLALGAMPHAARAASNAGAGLKIGIVGSGRIGGTLGALWLKAGHEIMFSSLDLEHDKALAARLGGKARAGTPKEAAAFGEVLLIAVPYSALPQVGRDLGDLLKGKVVLDPSNPIPARDGEIATWAREKGAGLASAELLPGTRIVRAFNAIGYTRLPEAAKRQERMGMPIAGDDANAIAVASRLVREVGYEPVLIGPLAMGKYLIPGTPLAGEHTPEQIRKIAATLK